MDKRWLTKGSYREGEGIGLEIAFVQFIQIPSRMRSPLRNRGDVGKTPQK